MKRLTLSAFLLLFAIPVILAQKTPEPPVQHHIRFAEIRLTLNTTGNRQLEKTVGKFTSSLPMGETGHLNRHVKVVNASRKKQVEMDLFLAVTPRLDENGTLHCVVVSTAKPLKEKPTERFRDMIFQHPGAKIMELYADAKTGTHLMLAISGRLLEPDETPAVSSSFPSIMFLVRTERWVGVQREQVESLQLQSLSGKTVNHNYARKIPMWVDKSDKSEDADDPFEKLPVIKPGKQAPVVKAGEGFTIISDTPEDQKPVPRGGKKKKGEDKPSEDTKKLVWKHEYYNLSITPESLDNGKLSLKIDMEGKIFDTLTRKSLPPVDINIRKVLVNGQPQPLFATHETPVGTAGFVIWVVPKWREEANKDNSPDTYSGPRSTPEPETGGTK